MNINSFRKSLGLGYRTSIWDSKIYNTKNSSHIFSKIRSDLDNDLKKRVIQRVGNNVTLTDFCQNGIDSFEWYGNCTKIQLPGYTLSSTDMFKFKSYVTNSSKKALTLSFLNDQWGMNMLFWRYYLSYICNGITVEYPANYIFNIELKIQDPLNPKDENLTDKFTFHNCYAESIPDIDFDRNPQTDIQEFNIGIVYEDFSHKI
jgi:hypothetical protein